MADYDIQVRVDASSAEASIEGLQSSLEGVADKADDAGSEIGERITKGADEARSKGGKHLDEINERLKSMGRLVKEAFAFAGIGLGIRELARMGDELTNVRNQVRELVGSQKELDQTITQLFGVARRSRAEFGAVADLFDNLSKSTRQYGLSNQQVLRLTESLTKSIVAEGRSVGEAAGAVRGLSIAFSTGTVNAGNMRRLLG